MRRFQGRKGWTLAAVAALALVGAGAVVGLRGTANPAPTTVSRVAVPTGAPAADAVGNATLVEGGTAGAPSAIGGSANSGAASQAQIAPAPTVPGGGPSTVVPGSPQIVRTVDLRVEVAKGGFGAAFDRVASIASANGGFVSASSTATNDKVRSGDLTVRVPSDHFDAVREALGGLGKVQSESIHGQDVSGQLVDYDARIKNLQAQEDSLRTLLGQAKAVGDVLSVQSNLFSVRQQIEQLQAQQANLQQSATLATIQVSLTEPGAPAVVEPVPDRSLAHSFRRATDGTVAVAGGMVVVVGWLVPVGVLGLLVWGGFRVFRRRPAAQVPVT